MWNFPVSAEPTIIGGGLLYIFVNLSSLAPGFGWKLCMLININWTNVDQSNNKFLNVAALSSNYCSVVEFLYFMLFAKAESMRHAKVHSWRDKLIQTDSHIFLPHTVLLPVNHHCVLAQLEEKLYPWILECLDHSSACMIKLEAWWT